MGKSVKLFMLGLLMACIVACKPTTSELEKEVKSLVNEKLSGTGACATEVTLIHRGGNDYTGIIKLSEDGEQEEYDINVVCDGRSFQYEIQY